MNQLFWNVVTWFLCKPIIFKWIQRRAKAHPYSNITDKTGKKIYMSRGWIFNRYDRVGVNQWGKPTPIGARWPKLPSIRLHHIRLPDEDRHHHDHPWDARTIILKNWYCEKYPVGDKDKLRHRVAGNTHQIKKGDYHTIVDVSPGGVWTLFLTWGCRDSWGFLVNGVNVPHDTYLQIREGLYKLVEDGKLPEKHFNIELEFFCNLHMNGDPWSQ